jgi:hypothetical protein
MGVFVCTRQSVIALTPTYVVSTFYAMADVRKRLREPRRLTTNKPERTKPDSGKLRHAVKRKLV